MSVCGQCREGGPAVGGSEAAGFRMVSFAERVRQMRRVGSPGARVARFASERMNAGATGTHCSARMLAVFREAGRRGKSRADLPARWRTHS